MPKSTSYLTFTKQAQADHQEMMDIFRALIIIHMESIRSLRELCRLLDFDLRHRRLYLIEQGQRGYGRSVLSRFISKVGADLLGRVIDEKVIKLLSAEKPIGVDVVLDASFIKAYSTSDSFNNQVGYSDPDARVGRHGKTYNLDYKLHLSIASKTMLPLASLVVLANQNEKRHSLWLLSKSRQQLRPLKAKLRQVRADSQYSHRELREK